MGPDEKQTTPLERAEILESAGEAVSKAPAFERHYTVREIAVLWQLSEDTVRRCFQGEPGVVRIATCRKGSKRRYITLRIPESVVERVHRKLSIVRVLNE
jgi:hypothetical protein